LANSWKAKERSDQSIGRQKTGVMSDFVWEMDKNQLGSEGRKHSFKAAKLGEEELPTRRGRVARIREG